MLRLTLVPMLSLVVATPAIASDGVLEINQTCAIQTGCFAGDAAGFPVTITAPGSYRLTSNLSVSNENTDGIAVGTSSISLDLGGFAIQGPVTCSGSPLFCTPASGTGSGVVRTSLADPGTSIENGSITGMGSYGVVLGDQAVVTNLRVRWNRVTGIVTGGSSIVSSNTAYQNGGDGISGLLGCTIVDNSSFNNGDVALPANDDGIQCIDGCLVKGNTVRSNRGFGINLSVDSAYSDNVVSGNQTGTVTGAGSANGRGGNYCAGTGTSSVNCP